MCPKRTHGTRNNGDAIHGVGVFDGKGNERMTGLMVGNANLVAAAPHGEKGGLVGMLEEIHDLHEFGPIRYCCSL